MPHPENEFAFSYLPKLGQGFQGQGYAFLALTHAMLAGELKGLFCFGQNPAVGGANARLIRAALDKLEWMVVADLFEHETASFWKRPGADPTRIPTEVFVLPATSGVEKEGSIVNSGRWAQWRFRAVKPIADCRPDLDIVDGLARAMKRAYEKDGVFPEPIRHLAWDMYTCADPARIPTEVFVLPATSGVEKEGSIVNSGRWAQWRFRAVKPIADCRPDLDIVDGLARAMKRAYEKDGVFPEPIRHLAWDYGGHEADPHKVARELNGRFLVDVTEKDGKSFPAGKQVPGFAQLKDDGSTLSGNWIYCGGYTEEGNLAARRDTTDAPNKIGLHPNWAWVWPMNRRILYNRASVNRNGEPFNPRKWVIRWNAEKKVWEGDVPDGAHAAGRDQSLYHAGIGGRAALLAGPRGRAVSRALRAGGEPGAKPVLQDPVESLRADLAVNRI